MSPAPVTIAIARTGTFKAKDGQDYTFTAKDFDEIAANYSAATEDAPLVFGHPQDNQPALGWAKRVFRRGERLFAQLLQVPDGVKEAVRKGRYKYVSMSLYPGGKRLRHIGLLGAVPPAISGLGPVEMSDNGDLTINFAAAELDMNGPVAGKTGAGKMDAEDQKRLGALEEQVKALAAQVSELTAARDKALAEAQEAKQRAEQAEKDKTEAQKTAETTQAEFSAYRGRHEQAARAARLEKLITDGKLTPGEKADTLAQAEALALIPQEMEFSSGKKLTPEEQFWQSLEKRGASPLLGPASPPAQVVEFSQGAADRALPDLSKKI